MPRGRLGIVEDQAAGVHLQKEPLVWWSWQAKAQSTFCPVKGTVGSLTPRGVEVS